MMILCCIASFVLFLLSWCLFCGLRYKGEYMETPDKDKMQTHKVDMTDHEYMVTKKEETNL